MVGFTSPVPLVTFRTPSNNPVKYPVSECQAARDQALRGMHNAGYGRPCFDAGHSFSLHFHRI